MVPGDGLRMKLEIEIPEELARAIGKPDSDEEKRLWASLKPADREDAVRRAVALTRWHDDRGDWTAGDAARAAGVTTNRFYALSSIWEDEDNRSLAVLGVAAEAPRRRRSAFDEGLLEQLRHHAQLLVSQKGADDRSISALATELSDLIPPETRKKPGTAVLRAMLVEARRQHRMHGAIGTDLGFDLSACQLADEEGRPHVLFVCIDRGTGFVLAYGFGDPSDSLSRHRALAAEAMDTWGGDGSPRLPWGPRTERVEMVVGMDRVPFKAWTEDIRSDLEGGSKVNLQATITPRRFGRYLREHFGTSVGRVRLLPSSTRDPAEGSSSSILTSERYAVEDAYARVGLEIMDHNDAILSKLADRVSMPPPIRSLLERLASN